MQSISGNKVFVLYPDSLLRDNVFYGELRNRFEIYYIYDYEKIKALVEYHPCSLIVLNLVNNDLGWLPEELCRELGELPDEKKPKIISLYDEEKPAQSGCSRVIQYHENYEELKEELLSLFIELGGKGRRNFVRYGGSDENIASIKIKTAKSETTGIVHDISAAGLSCSLSSSFEIKGGEAVRISLSLENKTIEINANKLLERSFNGSIVHVFKFNFMMHSDIQSELIDYIYRSLDSRMESFIKKLSN